MCLSNIDYNYISNQRYTSGDERLPLPTSGRSGQSLHIAGNAIDADSLKFIYNNDAIIDLVAIHFGIVRSASREQWHYECTDLRVSKSEQEIFETEGR